MNVSFKGAYEELEAEDIISSVDLRLDMEKAYREVEDEDVIYFLITRKNHSNHIVKDVAETIGLSESMVYKHLRNMRQTAFALSEQQSF